MACVLNCYYDYEVADGTKKIGRHYLEKLLLIEMEYTFKEIGLSEKECHKPNKLYYLPVKYPTYLQFYRFFHLQLKYNKLRFLKSTHYKIWKSIMDETERCMDAGSNSVVSLPTM